MLKNEPLPRKTLPIFFVLDTSGSMDGNPGTPHESKPITKLNEAIGETIQALRDEAKNNGDAQLECAILEFNSGANWITKFGLEDLTKEFFVPAMTAGGLTQLGDALDELNSKLSRTGKGFLNSAMGNYMPVIIFMSDGTPTQDWEKQLEEIRKNKWFRHAIKIAFALGDADANVLASVVGNKESVIATSNLDAFKKLLKFVSVTSSKIGSVSRPITENSATGEEVIQTIKQSGVVPPDEITTPPVDPKKVIPEPEPGEDEDDEWR